MTLIIKIKLLTKDTLKKDKYLKQNPPLCGIITLNRQHNHNVDTCALTVHLKSSLSLREKFEAHFNAGLSPAAALRFEESILLGQENGQELLADAHYLPKVQTVYWWHRVWRLFQFGPLQSPLKTLKSKIPNYSEQGRSHALFVNDAEISKEHDVIKFTI